MAISSSEISNIISGQVGMFSASAQYAQAISNQYGFQSGGSIGIVDPRDRQSQQLTAGNVGAFGARAPGMAMGGLGMMAMFGFAPRILDPFTATFNAGRMGMAGAGIGGAIGMGAATAGLYYGLSTVGGFATNNMVSGAQNRGLLNNQIGQIFPNMNSRGLNAMAAQVESMNRQGMGSIRELASLMQQGAATGALDTGSLNQFSTSFRKLVGNVRQVANVLNSTLTEASTAMTQVRSMGIRSDQAAAFLGTARGIGTVARINPQQMMSVAQAGANFGFQTGIERETGATGAMVSAGVYGLAQQNERLGVDSGAQGRYTQAATRFLLSGRGRTVLGAMMNEDGTIDTRAAMGISRGIYSREQIREMFNENINNPRMRRMLRSRRTEIAGEFISQFGPEAISGSLEAMTTGLDGQSRELLQQSLTGLNRRDIDSMRQLAAFTPQLRARLVQEARAGFREGERSVTGMQMMGIAFDRMIKPLRDQFRRMGANMTQAVSGAMEEVTGQFIQQRGVQGNFSDYQSMFRATQTGLNNNLRGFYESDMQLLENQFTTMPGRATGFGSFLNYLPAGLRAGAMPGGIDTMSSLPMGGMTTLDPRDAMAVGGLGLALRMNVFPGSRNFVGAVGAGTGALGRGMSGVANRMFPGSANQGFIRSLGGVGTVPGLARLPGGALRAGGLAIRGVGGLGRMLSLPMMAFGLTGVYGEANRMAGRQGFMEGAFSGNNARMLHALRGIGALGDTHMALQDVTGGGMTREDFSGVPVSGLFDAAGTPDPSGGHQYGLTEKGQEELKLITGRVGRSEAPDLIATLGSEGMSGEDFMSRQIQLLDVGKTTNPRERMRLLSDEISRQNPNLSPREVAQIIMNTPGALGKTSFASRRELRQDLMGKDTVEGFIANVAVRGSNDPRVENFAEVLRNDSVGLGGAGLLHRASRVFSENAAPDMAESMLIDAIQAAGIDGLSSVSSIKDSELLKFMKGGLDGTGDLSTILRDVALNQGLPTFGSTSLDIFGQIDMVAAAEAEEDQRGLQFGKGRRGLQNALSSGGHYLGMYDTGLEQTLTTLASGATPGGTMDTERDIRKRVTSHMFGEYRRKGLMDDRAVTRAVEEFGRDPTGLIGADLGAATYNFQNVLKDYDRSKKGSRQGRNARFLTKQARRMGLDLDFTRYTGDDALYLSGRSDGKDHIISARLERDLRAFGSQLFELNNPGVDYGTSEALQERNNIMDSLQAGGKDEAQLLDAFQRLSTARAPTSPSSANASGGGLQRKVAQVDTALGSLITTINDKVKALQQ